jgi:hypothetical protein
MPRVVACAVIHDDPPTVFVADDLDTLQWVLALKLIAQTPGSDIPEPLRDALRRAVVEEQWGEAVELWMSVNPGAIDVYPSYDLFTERDVALGPLEIQFTPLFEE